MYDTIIGKTINEAKIMFPDIHFEIDADENIEIDYECTVIYVKLDNNKKIKSYIINLFEEE